MLMILFQLLQSVGCSKALRLVLILNLLLPAQAVLLTQYYQGEYIPSLPVVAMRFSSSSAIYFYLLQVRFR